MKTKATYNTEFGEWLRARRKESAMTLEELGELTGFHKAHISNVEGGKKRLTSDFVLAVAQALDIADDIALQAAGLRAETLSGGDNLTTEQRARLSRIARRIQNEPQNTTDRDTLLTLVESVVDGFRRTRAADKAKG